MQPHPLNCLVGTTLSPYHTHVTAIIVGNCSRGYPSVIGCGWSQGNVSWRELLQTLSLGGWTAAVCQAATRKRRGRRRRSPAGCGATSPAATGRGEAESYFCLQETEEERTLFSHSRLTWVAIVKKFWHNNIYTDISHLMILVTDAAVCGYKLPHSCTIQKELSI